MFWTAVTARAMFSASGVIGTPTFTSSACAPCSYCFRASATIMSIRPSRIASANAFFPVGLIFSPILRKGNPWPIRTVFIRLVILTPPGTARGDAGRPPIVFLRRRM